MQSFYNSSRNYLDFDRIHKGVTLTEHFRVVGVEYRNALAVLEANQIREIGLNKIVFISDVETKSLK
jgi:hypothetical protein